MVAEQARIRVENREKQNRAEATRLVDGLLMAETTMVPSIIEDVKQYREWVDPALAEDYERAEKKLRPETARRSGPVASGRQQAGVLERAIARRNTRPVSDGAGQAEAIQEKTG